MPYRFLAVDCRNYQLRRPLWEHTATWSGQAPPTNLIEKGPLQRTSSSKTNPLFIITIDASFLNDCGNGDGLNLNVLAPEKTS